MGEATHPETTDVDAMCASLARMDRELAEAKERLATAEHERNEYRKLYELVHLELERTRRHLFGKKGERVADEQLALAFLKVAEAMKALEDRSDEPVPNSQRAGRQRPKRPPTGRKPIPDHLPVERIELPMPPEVQAGPEGFTRLGEDVSSTIEYRPGAYVHVQVVRSKFARKGDVEAADGEVADPAIVASELPTKPIPKGLIGPSFLAHVIICKHADHLPLHRLEGIIARGGIEVARSTMCGWLEAGAALVKPVVDAMWEDALTNAHLIATDATGVLVQAPDKCRRGHFWVACADRDHVLFRYSRHHDGAAARAMLDGFKGYVLADASSVFDQLYLDGSRKECGCWSHGRRYFFDALSTDPERGLSAIRLLRPLFAIEREIAELPRRERERMRRKRSAPQVARFFAWVDAQLPTVLDDTPIQKALQYVHNQRDALKRFLEDGRIPLTNNVSERQLRHEAIGRKNWMFLGSEDGAEWNTTFVSLIASAKLHGIEPFGYLRDLLVLLPDWSRNRVLELAPKCWQQTLEQTDAQERLARCPFRRISLGS